MPPTFTNKRKDFVLFCYGSARRGGVAIGNSAFADPHHGRRKPLAAASFFNRSSFYKRRRSVVATIYRADAGADWNRSASATYLATGGT